MPRFRRQCQRECRVVGSTLILINTNHRRSLRPLLVRHYSARSFTLQFLLFTRRLHSFTTAADTPDPRVGLAFPSHSYEDFQKSGTHPRNATTAQDSEGQWQEKKDGESRRRVSNIDEAAEAERKRKEGGKDGYRCSGRPARRKYVALNFGLVLH